MKKNVLFLLLVLFVIAMPVFVLSASEGGPARLLSMGGQEVIVADESTQLDLYAAGFGSAIFARPAVSYMSLYPELDVYTYNRESTSGGKTTMTMIGLGTGVGFASNNGIQLFLSSDSALVIKPMLSGLFGGEKYTPSNSFDTYKDIIPGGEVTYAQKFGKNIAASVTAGYLWEGFYDNWSGDIQSASIDKIEYEISAVMLPETADGWTFGLSAGNKNVMTLVYLSGINYNSYRGEILPMLGAYKLFNTHEYYKNDSTLTVDEKFNDYITSGLGVNLGAASAKSGASQFSIKAGLIVGCNITHKYKETVTTKSTGNKVTTTDPDVKQLSDGMGFEGQAAYRTDFGGTAFGIKVTDSYLSGKITGGTMWLDISKASFGPVFGDKKCLIPVELFYEELRQYSKSNANESSGATYDFGFRVGNELVMGDSMSFRYGVDVAALGDFYQDKTNGVVTSQSGAMGSKSEPWTFQAGYNAGMGFTGKSHELNIGVRVEPQWENQKSSYDKSRTTINGKVFSDLKIFF